MATKSRIREELRARRVVHRPLIMEKDPEHNKEEVLGKARGTRASPPPLILT
jgi:hypothetical protein